MSENQGIINQSVVPMRREPNDRSEMVNQGLFGESFTILEKQEKWLKIRMHHDGYEGWISGKQYQMVPDDLMQQCCLCSEILSKASLNGERIFLPAGARLWNLEKNRAGWKGFRIKTKAETVPLASKTKPKKIIRKAMSFLNVPYLWGGKTILGIDCSGLVQIVYSLNGTQLPRDASQQATFGVEVALGDCQTADLAFFMNAEGMVIHVGIILREKNGGIRIIHASGKVRVEHLDEVGIYTGSSQEGRFHTHHLHSIRRVIG